MVEDFIIIRSLFRSSIFVLSSYKQYELRGRDKSLGDHYS
jgi:hypothetical protein